MVVDTVTSQQEGSESSLGPFYVKFGVSLWVLSLPPSVQVNWQVVRKYEWDCGWLCVSVLALQRISDLSSSPVTAGWAAVPLLLNWINEKKKDG